VIVSVHARAEIPAHRAALALSFTGHGAELSAFEHTKAQRIGRGYTAPENRLEPRTVSGAGRSLGTRSLVRRVVTVEQRANRGS
jgi:hypothetical protein